jgi:hypothetical protein
MNTFVANVLMHEVARARTSGDANSYKIVPLFCSSPLRLPSYVVSRLRRERGLLNANIVR